MVLSHTPLKMFDWLHNKHVLVSAQGNIKEILQGYPFRNIYLTEILYIMAIIYNICVYLFHLISRVHIRSWLWSSYNRIKYEVGSHQLITVPDYYSAWLNKMAGTWWFKETKLLIASIMEWRGGATWVKHHAQQETHMGQNKPRNGQR